MDISYTYALVTNALSNARNIESLIRQKQLDLQLQDIHRQYQPFGGNRINATLTRQQMLHEIERLIIDRDSTISQAIDAAIVIVTAELANNVEPLFSVGSMALGNIISFIYAYRLKVTISFPTMLKISQLSSQLMLKGVEYFDLKNKVDRFRSY